ncbi:hypothetical protein [Alkanindiges illinoisensis]|uniref:hypothetical protein n=1 Tax=Alkanindiges illinoisensis TaxID=197183 RepID=UPI00047A59BD|nr:hypothetical protein [Alkanindiges illinoisensis]
MEKRIEISTDLKQAPQELAAMMQNMILQFAESIKADQQQTAQLYMGTVAFMNSQLAGHFGAEAALVLLEQQVTAYRQVIAQSRH